MNNGFLKQVYTAFSIMVVFTILLGFIYTFVIMGIGKVAFPYHANGSLIKENGKVIGSELIQQKFTSDKYFHGRPDKWNSNDYPTSKNMIAKINERIKNVQSYNGSDKPVPVGLVTDSGSSLDPEISLQAAYFQAERIAKNRGISLKDVNNLIEQNAEWPLLFIFSYPRVNVLKLNLALDKFCNKHISRSI